jgi:prepilin-type N-terminal cleavage/methylation domain-containing protein/prepilin-type processing-associated H-X9-DG protein
LFIYHGTGAGAGIECGGAQCKEVPPMLLRNPRHRDKGGFTLIELLVVVAIIALLISILLPSLSRAKAQARQVVCNTHLLSLAKTSRLYAADNKDYLPRGIQGFGAHEYTVFPTALIKYLGYDGDTTRLFGTQVGTRVKQQTIRLLRDVPQFQCPDFPDEIKPARWQESWETCPFDYVVSAFSIPYHPDAIAFDDAGELEWDETGQWEGESIPQAYRWATKLEDFPTGTSPAALIYVTEVHPRMTWDPRGFNVRFFTCFLASQLPFGGKPRIANDQRHPGGINAMFFDGHAKTMELHQMDCAWPNEIDKRLRWFTVMPDGYQP